MAKAERKKRGTLRTAPVRGRFKWLLAAGVLLAGAIIAVIAIRTREPAELAAFPAAPAVPTDSITFSDFVGSERCAECHASEHAAWSASTHGRAGQAPPRNLVLRQFDGAPIHFRDAVVRPRMSGGQYEFAVEWFGRTDRYPIVGVVGAGHMIGGGTQGFLWRHPDGSLRLLPFEIESRDRSWFCSTGTRADRGWVRITPDMSIADCGDWPPVRVFGSTARYASCQECHGSQIEITGGARPYETRFATLAINCESCHGPARAHVEARAQMEPLAALSRDQSIAVCMSCHALKVDVRRGYLPGRGLEQRYSLKLALLDGDELHADGRTRTFAYQQGHYYSDCYLSGSMTCVDCHEPHAQQYRDINGRVLPGRLADGQCTDCHASKAQQVERHTRHKPESEGSRCVACHMPFVQEAGIGTEIRYARSDHTIGIPRPELDEKLGMPNACRSCHADRSPEQLTQDTKRLWGELKPLRPVISGLVTSADTDDLEPIILARDTLHRFAYFDAVARYFSRLDSADAQVVPRRIRWLLLQLARSRDDDLAAIALATLHADAGRDPRVRDQLVAVLRALGPRDLSVRRRWAIALGHRGDALRARARHTEAIAMYGKALELASDLPELWHALGIARLDAGDALGAHDALQRAITVDPQNSLALINYGRARIALGDQAGGLDAYRRATVLNPYDALAFFNLGNAYIRSGNRTDAGAAYRRASELDVSLAPAHFNLARVLLLEGRDRDALVELRIGLVFDPQNQEAREVSAQLERELREAR